MVDNKVDADDGSSREVYDEGVGTKTDAERVMEL